MRVAESAEALTKARGRNRIRIIAVGAWLYALSGPGQTAGFSVFVDPVTASLDISRGQLTTGYLIATLLAAPSGIWLGRQLDHRKVATVIRSVGIGLALALCVAAASPALWMLTIGILGLRLFGQTGFTLTSSVYVARTITHRRGAALGALAAAGGAAITVTPLVASRLIPHLGWRQTWLLLAVVVAVAAHLLASAASRASTDVEPPITIDPNTPIDLNTTDRPDPTLDGETQPREMQPREMQPREMQPSEVVGLDRRQRTAFVVVAGGFSTTAAIGTALGFHQVALLGERGLTAGAAAANFLPQSVAAATVALTVGRLVDRVNGRVVIPFCMTLLSVALVSLRLVDSTATALLYGVMVGSASAAIGASEGALLARWLGTGQLGRIRGRLMATVVTASAVGPLAFTLLAEPAGSYTTAFTGAAVVPLGIGLAAALAPLPEHRRS